MEKMNHFSYDDEELTYHEFYRGTEYPIYCRACCEVISGPAYVYDDGDSYFFPIYGLHKSCAELPKEIVHPLHPHHPLKFKKRMEARDFKYGFICDGCRHYSWGFRYMCKRCRFSLDVQCISNHESRPLKESVEIKIDFHNHKLDFFYHRMVLPNPIFEDLVCCCCLKGFQDSGYGCFECLEYKRFFIHESCIDSLIQQVESPFHLQHLLELIPLYSGRQSCSACCRWIEGISFSCQWCNFNNNGDFRFHISCVLRPKPGIKLDIHEHTIFYLKQSDLCQKKCTVCNASLRDCSTYKCIACDVNFHIECIPLPHVVKHEGHPDHPLTLRNSFVPYNRCDEYRCDICEETGNPKDDAYHCEECFYAAHIECVLSEEYPPLEILSYLVPRSEGEAGQQYNLDNGADYSEEESDDVQENDLEPCSHKVQENHAEEEQENDLKDYSLEELDIIITGIKEKMDALASKLQIFQDIRAQKLNSLS